MASVVGKTIFSDGKGRLFFGYYKDNDAVEFVDYKTWKKLSFKDVSKGDTNKERVIKAILKKQKQFNKKVDFNMWSKKGKPSFEDKMDWFIKNGWINNINKGGIREGAGDINKAPIPGDVKIKLQKTLDVLNGRKLNYQQKLQVLGRVLDSMGIDKGELNKVTQKLRTKLESVNEGKKRYYQQDRVGSAKYTISYHDGKQKHKDGSDFFGIQTFKNKKDLAKFVNTLHKSGYVYGFNESVTEDKGEVEKIKKQVGKNEIKFYDALSKVEKRLGSKYPKFLDTALKQLKQNPSSLKTNADKEEKLFNLVK